MPTVARHRLVWLIPAALLLWWPGAALSTPHNARQTAEGYWIGGRPEAADITWMSERGIRIILSGVMLEEPARVAARRRHIERVNVWFGNNFPDADEILEGLAGYRPEEIYVHCTHGGDRAGALAAFLLIVQQGWRPDHALLAVAFPGEQDVDRLVALLEESGLSVTQAERETYVGIYSGASNGGTGGLKVRGPAYRNLVRTTLAACEGLGVDLTEAAEPMAVGMGTPAEALQVPVLDHPLGDVESSGGGQPPSLAPAVP